MTEKERGKTREVKRKHPQVNLTGALQMRHPVGASRGFRPDEDGVEVEEGAAVGDGDGAGELQVRVWLGTGWLWLSLLCMRGNKHKGGAVVVAAAAQQQQLLQISRFHMQRTPI